MPVTSAENVLASRGPRVAQPASDWSTGDVSVDRCCWRPILCVLTLSCLIYYNILITYLRYWSAQCKHMLKADGIFPSWCDQIKFHIVSNPIECVRGLPYVSLLVDKNLERDSVHTSMYVLLVHRTSGFPYGSIQNRDETQLVPSDNDDALTLYCGDIIPRKYLQYLTSWPKALFRK